MQTGKSGAGGRKWPGSAGDPGCSWASILLLPEGGKWGRGQGLEGWEREKWEGEGIEVPGGSRRNLPTHAHKDFLPSPLARKILASGLQVGSGWGVWKGHSAGRRWEECNLGQLLLDRSSCPRKCSSHCGEALSSSLLEEAPVPWCKQQGRAPAHSRKNAVLGGCYLQGTSGEV